MTLDDNPDQSPSPEWQRYAQKLGSLELALLDNFPDFLVIAPPRTGTTWLSTQLNCHSEIYIPPSKELRYFCTYWRWLDISWYLREFQHAPASARAIGEASTSYAILPERVIGLIHKLMPKAKLIFLMRDPIARAWSQAKHDFRDRTHNFASFEGEFDDVSPQLILDHVDHSLSLAFGDYLGSLQKWTRFFPKDNFYIGLYETIGHDPRKLLGELFEFLNVSPVQDWSAFQLSEKINASIEAPVPAYLEMHLREVYQDRVSELNQFLRDRFDMEVPPEWQEPARSGSQATANVHSVWTRQPSAEYLLDHFSGEFVRLYPRLVQENYWGFNIVFFRGRFLALDLRLGHVDLIHIVQGTLDSYARQGQYFIARSFAEVRQMIEAHGPPFPVLLEEDYGGFNLVALGKDVYGLAISLGPLDLSKLDSATRDDYCASGKCVIGKHIDDVKFMINKLNEPDHISQSHK